MVVLLHSLKLLFTGAHLGFSEGRVQTLEKGQTNIKPKINEYKSYISDNFLIIRSYKIRYTYDCRKKNIFKEVKPN